MSGTHGALSLLLIFFSSCYRVFEAFSSAACGVRPYLMTQFLEVCGVRLTPVVCGVGLHRSRRCAESASPWWSVELASPGGLWGGLRSSPPKEKGEVFGGVRSSALKLSALAEVCGVRPSGT